MVKFEAPDFSYTLSIGPLLRLLLDILLLFFHGDPTALDVQVWPLHMLQPFIDEVNVVG